MTQPRRTNSYSREPDLEGLDPSSAWVGDESAVIPPVALEPYDWTLEDDAKPFTQVIPIPPPVREGSAKLRRPKRKAEAPETSVLIPVEKVATDQVVRKNGVQPATPLPLPAPQVAPSQPARITRALPRPKRMVSSLLLLLLSVIAVFIFAYIAQK
ncbi:MAG: hypothetical protein MOB07_17270 [Acidobacteria bacterium]|nr:hypothetical protein [Acidobacteriota bacterium]